MNPFGHIVSLTSSIFMSFDLVMTRFRGCSFEFLEIIIIPVIQTEHCGIAEQDVG
jgi:hypothetical protein